MKNRKKITYLGVAIVIASLLCLDAGAITPTETINPVTIKDGRGNIKVLDYDAQGSPSFGDNIPLSYVADSDDLHPKLDKNSQGQIGVVFEVGYDIFERNMGAVFSADGGETFEPIFELVSDGSGILEFPDIKFNPNSKKFQILTVDRYDASFRYQYWVPEDFNPDGALGFIWTWSIDPPEMLYERVGYVGDWFPVLGIDDSALDDFGLTMAPGLSYYLLDEEAEDVYYPDDVDSSWCAGSYFDGGSQTVTNPASACEWATGGDRLHMAIQADLDAGSKIVHKATTSNLNPDVDPFLFQDGGGYGGMDEFADIEVWPWQGYIADGTNPDISASGSNVCVVYMQNGDVKCSYSTNDGDDFSVSTVATGAGFPAVYVRGSDVHCAYVKDNNLYYVASENAGATWGEPMQINNVGGSVLAEPESVDIIDSGVVWTDSRDGDYNIYFTTIAGGGPNAPTITGPASGKINRNHDFTVTTTDPGGSDVWYFIDWGDGTDSGWLGPYSSGTGTTESHKWTEEAEVTIRAKAKNAADVESDWGTLAFSAPRDRAIFLNFLENFPRLYQILEYFFGL